MVLRIAKDKILSQMIGTCTTGTFRLNLFLTLRSSSLFIGTCYAVIEKKRKEKKLPFRALWPSSKDILSISLIITLVGKLGEIFKR